MPDWLYNWNIARLDFWHEHPFAFWTLVVVLVTLSLLTTRRK
jgi:hypothetical protein